ncbi:hypothetical protein COL52_31140, partial [Bacillus toyonensis]
HIFEEGVFCRKTIKNLKALSLTDSTVLDGKNEIDLRAFSNLERLFQTLQQNLKKYSYSNWRISN